MAAAPRGRRRHAIWSWISSLDCVPRPTGSPRSGTRTTFWITEVEASYELADREQLHDLPRVFVVRMAPVGIADLRVYGAHEHPLPEHSPQEEGIVVGARLLPPL
jgi:hypothetical protein